MSAQYDLYLQKHKANVHKSFEWIRENLPELLLNLNTENIEWQIEFAHDASKSDPDEYEAYDAYFYGGNKSFKVVQNFNKAWLLHIHRNPHHWQHWILIHDDPNEPETILDMPYNYILEMICDWWSFSWRKKNLFEIFNWYDEHKDYIKLSDKTRKTVEDILNRIKEKLSANVSSEELMHHGIKGQKWGVKNGPPYPLKSDSNSSNIVSEAIRSGEVSTIVKRSDQEKHIISENDYEGRSYIYGDLEDAQKLIDKLSCTGEPVKDRHGNWTHKERVVDSEPIGCYVNPNDGSETETNKAMIVYSRKGSHIYPRKED